MAVRLRCDPQLTICHETMGGLIASLDLEVGEVVQKWLDANEATWKAWTDLRRLR
jgi:ABC-type proline/glycine betaine transport system substrate-binding protein